MMLRLAGSDFSFPMLGFEEALDLIKAIKLSAVDVCLFEGHRHLVPSIELARPEENGRRLREIVRRRGLDIADVFLVGANSREALAPNNPSGEDNRRSRDVFERALDYLSAAEAGHLTQLPGVSFPEEEYERSFARAASELEWRAGRAAERGITFAVEPHAGSIIDTPEKALRMAQSASRLTYSLDYSHFTRAGFSDGEIEPLAKWASHFHIRGTCRGRLQAPFKENAVDYARALRKLADVGYSGFHAIEYVWIEWERCNECDNLSEIILFRDFLTSLPFRLSCDSEGAPT